MKRVARGFALLGALVLLAACASKVATQGARDKALYDYAGAVRWSEFERAWEFVDPAFRDGHPLSDLELERFKQIQVTGYEVKTRNETPDGVLEQRVEIRLVGKHTQIERAISDYQRWRWDPDSKRFWLTTGLPDISAH